ncbi:hypothetical protein COOONC_04657 [Cooperia oncophora]
MCAFQTKNVSSVESNSVPPSTSTSTSTTPATATIEEDLITSSSVIDDGDSTNLSTTSVEARTSSSSSEFLATPTFPAVKIMAPESVSSEEESSTTLASAVLLPSTHPQLTTIIAASTTAIGIETSKRDSQMATRAKVTNAMFLSNVLFLDLKVNDDCCRLWDDGIV